VTVLLAFYLKLNWSS